jgi:hypothetical protein
MTEKIRELRAKAVATAEDIVAGKISIITGSHILSRLAYALDISENDDDFLIFSAIASETDDLPIGPERKLWAHEALKEKDAEIRRCEDLFRLNATEACKSIIRKWK